MPTFLLQASYSCGNFSDNFNLINRIVKRLISHLFIIRIHIENLKKVYPYGPSVSVLFELTIEHQCNDFADLLYKPNTSSEYVISQNNIRLGSKTPQKYFTCPLKQRLLIKKRVKANSKKINDGKRKPGG